MIGMGFNEFLILLVIAIVVSFALNSFAKLSLGKLGIAVMIIVAWLGSWVGSPVLGYWFEAIRYESIYIIPAILGALGAVILLAYCERCCLFHKGDKEQED